MNERATDTTGGPEISAPLEARGATLHTTAHTRADGSRGGGWFGTTGGAGSQTEDEANARRLAAAWNACIGTPTEELLGGATRPGGMTRIQKAVRESAAMRVRSHLLQPTMDEKASSYMRGFLEAAAIVGAMSVGEWKRASAALNRHRAGEAQPRTIVTWWTTTPMQEEATRSRERRGLQI